MVVVGWRRGASWSSSVWFMLDGRLAWMLVNMDVGKGREWTS